MSDAADAPPPLADTSTRRIVSYADMGEGSSVADTPAKTPRQHWTDEGKPQSASASRKYNRVLELLSRGEIEAAEGLLNTDAVKDARKNVEIQQALVWARRKANEALRAKVESSRKRNSNGRATDSAANDSTDRPLTHEEIWDDSALIDAWEAAVEEFHEYDAKRRVKRRREEGAESSNGNGIVNGALHEEEVDDQAYEEDEDDGEEFDDESESNELDAEHEPDLVDGAASAPAAMPSSYNEVLQNLATSWYNAGYYQAMAQNMYTEQQQRRRRRQQRRLQ